MRSQERGDLRRRLLREPRVLAGDHVGGSFIDRGSNGTALPLRADDGLLAGEAEPVCQSSYCRYHLGMRPRKQRLTVTVDPELIDAGQRAVESGEAESVSGWVSSALAEKVRRDRKLRLLAAAVEEFERELGEITDEEIAEQRRADRQRATVVRGPRRSASSRPTPT